MAPARPSLLWPGRAAAPFPAREAWLLGAAYALALAVRATILDAEPYTAEAAHYAMARTLWRGVGNLDSLFDDVVPDDFSWFFWQRPLLCLLYWPGAALGGFAGFRLEHVLVSSLAPPLAALLLRRLDVGPAWAYGASLALCVHPVLVPWAVLVLPDSTVLVLTLAGLLAAHAGRPLATAALLLASAWVKEVGAVTVLVLFLLACWRDADGSRIRLWPLRVGRFPAWLLLAGLLAPVPLLVSLQMPFGAVPGFRIGGDLAADFERLALSLWLLPLALLGLALPAVRRLAAVAAAWVLFFVAYHLATGKAIEIWYHVVPATLSCIAAAATLSHLAARRPESPLASRRSDWPLQRAAALGLSLVVALLVAVPVLAPQGTAANQAAATPLTGTGQWNLEEALAYEDVRGDDLAAVVAAVPPEDRGTWTALDMDYSLAMHPLASLAERVNKDFTPAGPLPDDAVRWWAGAVERGADATFLWAGPGTTDLNQAIRDAYAPCALTVGQHAVVQPDACQGFEDRLVDAYHRRAAAS